MATAEQLRQIRDCAERSKRLGVVEKHMTPEQIRAALASCPQPKVSFSKREYDPDAWQLLYQPYGL